MNLTEYDLKKNKAVFICWYIICSVLTLAYIMEYIKGNRSIYYVVSFLLFTWIPLIISKIISIIIGREKICTKYFVIAGYNIFYVFTLFTTNSKAAFVYIIPMISILIVYNDTKLISIVYITAIIENICYIKYYTINNVVSAEDVTFFEIQIACLILSMIFMIIANSILKYTVDKTIKLYKDVNTDNLTGLYNRKFLDSIISDKIAEEDISISMALMDIDDFKHINDKYGHLFGDIVLKRLSILIKESAGCAEETYPIRLGGDEFVIISFSLSRDELCDICEELCNKVSNTGIKNGSAITNYNISIGVANTLTNNCRTFDELYTKADALLYKVKKNGKNSVAK